MGFLKDIDDALGIVTAPLGRAGREIRKVFTEDENEDEENKTEYKENKKKRQNEKRKKK